MYQQPYLFYPGMGQGLYPPTPPFFPNPNPQLDSEAWRLNQTSYIENILRLNLGKAATVYMNFEGSQWGSKVFKGIILASGKDHLILKDQNSTMRYLLLTIYLSYITFDEEINYEYPFAKE